MFDGQDFDLILIFKSLHFLSGSINCEDHNGIRYKLTIEFADYWPHIEVCVHYFNSKMLIKLSFNFIEHEQMFLQLSFLIL